MKKLFDAEVWVAIICLFFLASCSGSDHNIDSRFVSQQCPSMPVAQAMALPNGMQWIGVPNPDGTVPVCDSMYTVSPSSAQKVEISKHDGTFGWGIGLFVLCLVLIAVGCKMGYNGPSGSYVFVFVIGLGICSGMGGASCIDWAHSKQADIRKADYVDQMQRNGNLSEFWAQNLFK